MNLCNNSIYTVRIYPLFHTLIQTPKFIKNIEFHNKSSKVKNLKHFKLSIKTLLVWKRILKNFQNLFFPKCPKYLVRLTYRKYNLVLKLHLTY